MLRMQRLRELCKRANRRRFAPRDVCDETMQALEYLRSEVAILVDHSIEEESSQFHQLCAQLCLLPPAATPSENTNGIASILPEAIERGIYTPFKRSDKNPINLSSYFR